MNALFESELVYLHLSDRVQMSMKYHYYPEITSNNGYPGYPGLPKICFKYAPSYRPPWGGAPPFFESYKRPCAKVKPVNHMSVRLQRGSGDLAWPPLVPMAASSWPSGSDRERRRKNKLKIWGGYLINHDNIVWPNEHSSPT